MSSYFCPPTSPSLSRSHTDPFPPAAYSQTARGARYLSNDFNAIETLRNVADWYDVDISAAPLSASDSIDSYFSDKAPLSAGLGSPFSRSTGTGSLWGRSSSSFGHALPSILQRARSDVTSANRGAHRRAASDIRAGNLARSSSNSSTIFSSSSRRLGAAPFAMTSSVAISPAIMPDRASVLPGSFLSSSFGSDGGSYTAADGELEEERESFKTNRSCQTCPLIFPGLPQYWGDVTVDEDGKLLCSNGCKEPGMPRVRRGRSITR